MGPIFLVLVAILITLLGAWSVVGWIGLLIVLFLPFVLVADWWEGRKKKQIDKQDRIRKQREEMARTSARNLVEALQNYRNHPLNVERPELDPDLTTAYRKGDLAKKIVNDGGIALALWRLCRHVKYWPSWIARDDFGRHVCFDATEIVARKREQDGRRDGTIDISFVFGQRHYRVVFVVFTDTATGHKGEIGFHFDNRRVLRMRTIEDMEVLKWISVEAFHPGDWMQELLRIEVDPILWTGFRHS